MNLQKISKPPAKLGIFAWCCYDWANSAFPTLITTFIFATYFTQSVAVNPVHGTAQWGNATACAGLIIAFASPLIGAITDYQGRRKPWLAFFTIIAAVAAALLWYAKPTADYVTWTLAWVIIGTVSFEIATVFYNAMLRDIAPPDYLGRISGWGWGFGYLGGLASLIIALFVFIKGDTSWLGLDHAAAEPVRLCGPFVALWLLVFSWPLFLFTADRPATGVRLTAALQGGLRTLVNTLRQVPRYRVILWFLVAHMIYADGLNTLFAFGGIYAAGTFGMTPTQIIVFGIVMNVAAGTGALAFAWLDDLIGAQPTILIALAAMIISGGMIVVVTNTAWFWLFSTFLCLFIGPVQAASRSLMARLAPAALVTEMFGLYAFSGKATAFIGPWLLGWVTVSLGSQRAGIATIILFLVLGMLLLLLVRVPKINESSEKTG